MNTVSRRTSGLIRAVGCRGSPRHVAYPLLVSGMALLPAACDRHPVLTEVDSEVTSAVAPQHAVSDGANAGNRHFYFLPPLVPRPGHGGGFDAEQHPTVEICVWEGAACGPVVERFTTDIGRRSESIRVDARSEQYVVNWRTREVAARFPVDASSGRRYRIHVRLGARILGYADVVLVKKRGQLRDARRSGQIGLVAGRTLPIRFRIEEGAAFGTLYAIESSSDGLSIVDPVTGAMSFVGPLHPDPDIYATPVAMAVHPSDGTIFVWNNSDLDPATGDGISTGVLLTVDPATGLARRVDPDTPPQGVLSALAFSPDGRLFGVDSHLFEIDPDTGVRREIGPIGFRVAAADFDPSGRFWGVELSLTEDRLVQVDLETGTPSVVGSLGTNRIGSITFAPDGTLLGTDFSGLRGELFDIDLGTAATSNYRSIVGGFMPQGLGFSR
jgi:hypothetical protein